MSRLRHVASGGIVSLCLGALSMTATAGAAGDPGSSFEAVKMVAEAGGQRIIFSPASTGQGAGFIDPSIPLSTVNLEKSGGSALASLAWPGAAPANAGDLLVLLGAPEQATVIRSPVRAEAQSGSGEPVVTAGTTGAQMIATATSDKVTSEAVLGGTQNAVLGTADGTTTTARAQFTGESTAVVEATSRVEDLVFGDGLVKVGSVTSHAKAGTDGLKASASGGTLVSDLVVGGVPVTVDEDGVHAAGNGSSTDAATTAANAALAASGTSVHLTAPTSKVVGASVVYDAGALVISTGDGSVLVVVGGARVTASGSREGALPPVPQDQDLQPVDAAPALVAASPPLDSGAEGGTLSSNVGLDAPELAPVDATTPTEPEVAGAATPIDAELAAQPLSLPTGLSPAWLLLVVAAVGIGALLRRLPDRVLITSSSTCPLGDPR